jgi:transposase
MFIRIAKQKRGDKLYRHLQIAESFRDPEKGNAPRTRILAHLGTIEGLGTEQIEKLIAGLQKAIGRLPASPELAYARDYGHVHAVCGVLDKLDFSGILARAGVAGRSEIDVTRLIQLLVVNRLCDPCSKLAVLDWLDGVWFPDILTPSYQHLLRAMDHLILIKDKVEPLLAKALLGERQPVSLVFYDITSTYFETERSLPEDDIRRYGYSRDHRQDRRQVVIGMVIAEDGIPLCHHVFPGNTVDKATVIQVVSDLKHRFKVQHIIFVGDRGMLSDANLEHLIGEDVGFIVAHPLRKSTCAAEVIGKLGKSFDSACEQEQYREDLRLGVRFVLAYSAEIAGQTRQNRGERLKKADQWLAQTLKNSDNRRGRPLSLQGTYNRVRDYLRDRNLLAFYTLESATGEIVVKKDRKALNREEKIDGMLLLETTDLDTAPEIIVKRYKELAEIERGWRTLKTSIELRPVYHWTEKRIRAHIFICVLALQIERWMRNHLKILSVQKALHILRHIKAGVLRVGEKSLFMTTTLTEEQKQLFGEIGVKPTAPLLSKKM